MNATPAKPALLIVDDDEDIRAQMKWALAADYDVTTAGDRPGALAELERAPRDVVLLDLGLPPRPADPDEGLQALAEILVRRPGTKVIVITGQGEKTNALQAIGTGAYDFMTKPVDMPELALVLKRAFHVARLEREYRALQQHTASDGFEGMLGNGSAMQEVFSAIRKVATTDVPVFILGESGTGKEMCALAVHRRSSRREGPFIAINCAAIPENLLESELFGHEKGSFTGAHALRKGRIESANGGTLFLDEIGDLPLALQVKLLRFLQEQQIERIGGRVPIEVDVRVIAATNANIREALQRGTFREDLYYRLAVLVLQLPRLQDRQGDVMLLANGFLHKYAAEFKKEVSRFTQQSVRALESYTWPGNVRELENRVKRAVIMTEGRQIGVSDLELMAGPESLRTLREAREAAEREVIQASMVRNKGKISAVAVELDISRPALYEILEKLGIRRAEKDA
ncbi:MAG: PEP-CTERM-box response regulator transcription factor [Lentisphaerae bacterium]|nr:PEP-CTERM-box response regulator transcription factor [Lentisphaerota bacterium]